MSCFTTVLQCVVYPSGAYNLHVVSPFTWSLLFIFYPPVYIVFQSFFFFFFGVPNYDFIHLRSFHFPRHFKFPFYPLIFLYLRIQTILTRVTHEAQIPPPPPPKKNNSLRIRLIFLPYLGISLTLNFKIICSS